MDSLETLIAIEEIKRLKADYFDLVDSKRWEDWGNLFVEDCVAEFVDEPPGFTVTCRSELIDLVSEGLKDALTIHRGDNPRIDIVSPTEAKGVWAMQDWLHWPEGVPLPQGVRNMKGWGHYTETYRKTKEGWRFVTLRLTRQLLKKY